MSRAGFRTLVVMAVSCLAACTERPAVEPEPPAIPPPTSPENLVKAIEVIFNDTLRSAGARVEEFGDLFAPDFRHFIETIGWDAGWGLDQEIAQARILFEARDGGDIETLGLRIMHDPAGALYPPEEDREGWKEVFVTRLDLLLVRRPGYEVPEDVHWVRSGLAGQARIKFSPAPDGSRWFIAEWLELPRP